MIVFAFVFYSPVKYNNVYEYPGWAIAIGWLLILASLLWIPGYAIYKFLQYPGTLREVRRSGYSIRR